MARVEREPRSISRRSLIRAGVLALGAVACKPVEAALNQRTYVVVTARESDIGNGGVIPRKVPTPVPTATPKTSEIPPTPTSVATPDTRPSSPWPVEVLPQLRVLPVLDRDRLRFGYYTDYNQIPYEDIKAIFTPEGGANADVPRRMVHLLTHQELTNMWVILTIGHEIFHHHEAWISMQNNPSLTIPFNYQQEYLNSPEGREYVAASDTVVRDARSRGMTDLSYLTPWEMPNFGVNTYEEAASMGSIWYHQRSWLDRDILAPIKSWALKRLPTT